MRGRLRAISTGATLLAVACLFLSPALSAPGGVETICTIDFELVGNYVNMPVTEAHCSPLTLFFSNTKPGGCDPYLGKWGGPVGEGWLCYQNSTQDETIPLYAGGKWFLTWVNCDPHDPANKTVIRFSELVDKVEGEIFDIDNPGLEHMTITALDMHGWPVATTTVGPFAGPNEGDCRTVHWVLDGGGTDDIWKVEFEGYKTVSTVGFGVDDIRVTYHEVPIPNWVNKDLKNLGPAARDIAVLIQGTHTFPWHYDGGSSGYFDLFTAGPAGPNTLLHWSGFHDGNNQIDHGEVIHVGWATYGSTMPLDCYFTDANGARVSGSKILQVGAHGMTDDTLWWGVVWKNVFAANGIPQDTVRVRDVRYAVLPAAIHLDSLNRENLALAGALQPLPGGQEIILPFGEEIVRRFDNPMKVGSPSPIPRDHFVVLTYTVEGPGSTAEVMDFVEFGPPATIPTLSEWGAIIFGTLLFASVVFYIWRRRRVVTA